jgi:hypothetical protein
VKHRESGRKTLAEKPFLCSAIKVYKASAKSPMAGFQVTTEDTDSERSFFVGYSEAEGKDFPSY